MANQIDIYRGDDKTINVTVKDSNGVVDITGYTFWFTVKADETDTDGDAKIQKEVTSHTAPASGETAIVLSTTDTDLEVRSYYYDIQMKDTTNSITTLLKDRLLVNQDITQTV